MQVCGVAEATKDRTLVRKARVLVGNRGNWTLSAGTSAQDCEWRVLATDVWDNLGVHEVFYPSSTSPPTSPTPSSPATLAPSRNFEVHSECVETRSWIQLRAGLRNSTSFTGGLGGLMTRDFHVWFCIQGHPCIAGLPSHELSQIPTSPAPI